MKQIVLLRGVNVGGRNKLPMKTFASVLEGLGASEVKTYIQSGNAVCSGKLGADDIKAALKEHAGLSPHVFVIGASELAKIARANPFAREAEASGKSVHLFLLQDVPAADLVAALGEKRKADEDFAVIGRAVFLHTPKGAAGSGVMEAIDRVLKTQTTARNWNTVRALLDLAEAA